MLPNRTGEATCFFFLELACFSVTPFLALPITLIATVHKPITSAHSKDRQPADSKLLDYDLVQSSSQADQNSKNVRRPYGSAVVRGSKTSLSTVLHKLHAYCKVQDPLRRKLQRHHLPRPVDNVPIYSDIRNVICKQCTDI